jgi:hypothetical protein
MTLKSLISLLDSVGEEWVLNTCSLSTLVVENYFSIIRSKVRNPSLQEHGQIAGCTMLILAAKHALHFDASGKPVARARVALKCSGKCYGSVAMQSTLWNEIPALKMSYTSSREKKTSACKLVLSKEQQERLEQDRKKLAPQANFSSTRQAAIIRVQDMSSRVCRDLSTRTHVRCPHSAKCGQVQAYAYNGSFVTHLLN